MRLTLKRTALIIEPENDQDKAFIEDTLGLKTDGESAQLTRVNDVSMGFADSKTYVLKVGS